MILAARTGRDIPMLELARKCTEYGGYTVSDTGQIKGLIYAPFVRFIKEAFHVDAEVVTGMTAHGIAGVLQHAEFFIASGMDRRCSQQYPASSGVPRSKGARHASQV
jgi:hypothetical protein